MYKTSDEVEYQNKKQTKISLDNSKKKVKKLFEHHFKETRHPHILRLDILSNYNLL